MKRDFEREKDALLKEIHDVLNEVEELYQSGAERGAEETQALKAKLQKQLGLAQNKLQDLEESAVERVKHHAKQTDDFINDKPYYAMGFAALAGLVVGVLLNRR